ncbi:hypothetical protein RhiirC2_230912 [Rhizophagus irregularis]|uniref:HMG box domain-containing protein n=1 Tax=Rhizophagus irregularis TaxID=588596 RepID=A0A2N1P1P9_9GLOM|nr:hypothetical protein RhiirC2_230912 [Rhizophagus irregularis]
MADTNIRETRYNFRPRAQIGKIPKVANCFLIFNSNLRRSKPKYVSMPALDFIRRSSHEWRRLPEKRKSLYRREYEIKKYDLEKSFQASTSPQYSYMDILNM